MDEELPTTMEQALARARAEASELRRMVEVQEAAMATAAARQQRNGDAVAYAATLERWRQEVFAGAVRRRIHDDQGVHLHAARRAAADAIRTAALCERRWRAAQAHAAAADAARRESEELLGRERRGVVHACRNAFDAMRRDAERRETTLVRTASRLDEHAARLRKASDRVACAAELVRQREAMGEEKAKVVEELSVFRAERKGAEEVASREHARMSGELVAALKKLELGEARMIEAQRTRDVAERTQAAYRAQGHLPASLAQVYRALQTHQRGAAGGGALSAVAGCSEPEMVAAFRAFYAQLFATGGGDEDELVRGGGGGGRAEGSGRIFVRHPTRIGFRGKMA